MLYDLLVACPLLQSHALSGKVGLGINHPMNNPSRRKPKKFDLVIAHRLHNQVPLAGAKTFKQLGATYGMLFDPAEQTVLSTLPDVPVLIATGLPVLLALEAKACFTRHSGAIPRLSDELEASYKCAHSGPVKTISAGFFMVNSSATFISSDANNFPLLPQTGGHAPRVSKHTQPRDAMSVISAIGSLPVANNSQDGFDALGIAVVKLINDGVAPMTIETAVPPAPALTDAYHYTSFIHTMANLYATRFSHI